MGNRAEARGDLGDHVSVRHPHIDLGRQPVEDAGALIDADGGVPVLATLGRPHRTTQLMGEQLHAVADAEDGQIEVVQSWVGMGRTRVVDGRGSSTEDESARGAAANLVGADGAGHELAVDPRLANAAGDEL